MAAIKTAIEKLFDALYRRSAQSGGGQRVMRSRGANVLPLKRGVLVAKDRRRVACEDTFMKL
jgi:hypothetical protein